MTVVPDQHAQLELTNSASGPQRDTPSAPPAYAYSLQPRSTPLAYLQSLSGVYSQVLGPLHAGDDHPTSHPISQTPSLSVTITLGGELSANCQGVSGVVTSPGTLLGAFRTGSAPVTWNSSRQNAEPQWDSKQGYPTPQLQLAMRWTISDTAPSVMFALKGNIKGLQDLFLRGLGSPRDVSYSRGFSLLRVRTTPSFPCFPFILFPVSLSLSPPFHFCYPPPFPRVKGLILLVGPLRPAT